LNKALLDAIKNIIIEDDCKIYHLEESKKCGQATDFIDIQIERISDVDSLPVPDPPQTSSYF